MADRFTVIENQPFGWAVCDREQHSNALFYYDDADRAGGAADRLNEGRDVPPYAKLVDTVPTCGFCESYKCDERGEYHAKLDTGEWQHLCFFHFWLANLITDPKIGQDATVWIDRVVKGRAARRGV